MKKFPHETFLDENSIDYKLLPEMLYKRIKGFEELKEDLEHTTDEDKEKLTERLEMLSHELLEDLEEHFGDHLENNDQEEEEVQPEPVQEPEQEQPKVEELTPEPEPEAQPEPETQPEPEVQSEPTKQEEEPVVEAEAAKEPSDEEILEGLIKAEKHLVLPSELQEKGFKSSLKDKRVVVGKFCLHRGKYDTCYKIIIKSE